MRLSKRLRRALPAIPDLPPNTDPKLRAVINAMKEALEVRLGRRGDPMEEMLTRQDLVDTGLAVQSSPSSTTLVPVIVEDSGSRIIPPVPLGFSAEGVLGGVSLSWENPFQAYRVHAFTEVWRGQSADPESRILISSSRGSVFFDRIPDDDAGDYWYWIRFVSTFNREGPFSLPFQAAKPADAARLIEELSGKLDESMLTSAFRDEIALMQNSWGIKLDPSGSYASGFMTYNDGRTASFAVLADEFYIGSPAVGRVKPFIVSDGTVYIDTAVIREASIDQGKLGAISFGKITDSAGRPVTTVAGRLRADVIDVENLQVTDGNIAGVLRSNAVASNGQPRWVLDKEGGLTLNGSGVGGRMEVRDDVIKVFDSAVRVRVQIGNLKA